MNEKILKKLSLIMDLSPQSLPDLACTWDLSPAVLKPLLIKELSQRQQLYFAYGSNMLTSRIQAVDRAPHCQFIGASKLENHALRFDLTGMIEGETEGGGVANIRPELGQTLWGVLYWLPQSEMERLNKLESDFGYQVHFESVHVQHLGDFHAFYYMAGSNLTDELRPTPAYQSYVIDGALEHSLPKSYIEALQTRIRGLHEV